MAESCVSLGCPEVIRLAEQDPCTGAPVRGAGKGMVMRCQRNVGISARVKDADTSTFESDCGMVDEYTVDAYVQGYDVTFETARISPQLHAFLLGHDLLQIDGVNVGFIEEAAVGCADQTVRPTFFVEAFYRVRQCDPTSGSQYLRRLIPGVKFNPVEDDKEGKIGIERYTGRSTPMLTVGAIDLTATPDNAGPYNDIPDDIVTDLVALPDTHMYVGMRFVDPISDPVSGITLEAGTCYSATVPAAG